MNYKKQESWYERKEQAGRLCFDKVLHRFRNITLMDSLSKPFILKEYD